MKDIIKALLELLTLSDKVGRIIGGPVGLVLQALDVVFEYMKKKYNESLEQAKKAKKKMTTTLSRPATNGFFGKMRFKVYSAYRKRVVDKIKKDARKKWKQKDDQSK